MRFAWSIVACLLVTALAGCAIHPAPKDFCGVSTYDIVKRIRCETKQAAVETALDYLAKGKNVDAVSRATAARFVSDRRPIEEFHPKLFTGEVRTMLSAFWKTGVAYNFTLDMKETNALGTQFNLLRPFTGNTFSLGVSAGISSQRQNTRTFTVTDNVEDLVQKLSPDYCSKGLVGPNYIYPITGRIGVREMIEAFVALTLFGNLGGPQDAPKGPPTLVDALDFQTTLSGSVSPKIEFKPGGDALRLTDAALSASAQRSDDHQVVIGLAIDETAVGQVGKAREVLVGRLLTARTDNAAEREAANAVDQYLAQTVFSPVIVINQ